MTTDLPAAPGPAKAPAQASDRDGFSWSDFFGFRFMVTPVLITAVYIVGVVVITIGAVLAFLAVPVSTSVDGVTTSSGLSGVLGAVVSGVVFFLVGQLFWRVWMELLIVIFRIYGSLRSIDDRGQGM